MIGQRSDTLSKIRTIAPRPAGKLTRWPKVRAAWRCRQAD